MSTKNSRASPRSGLGLAVRVRVRVRIRVRVRVRIRARVRVRVTCAQRGRELHGLRGTPVQCVSE